MPVPFLRTNKRADATPSSVVEALDLGQRVGFDQLLAAVSEAHGKPIVIRNIDNSVIPNVTGLWIETEKKSVILLPERDSELHRAHAACHEFGHILLGHDGCGAAAGPIPSLFQHIGRNSGIKRMLARSLQWNDEEKAAERVAYLLSKALRQKGPEGSSEFERTFL